MTKMDLEGLRRLSAGELGRLHHASRCPSPDELRGVMHGELLATRLPRPLQLWRGKVASTGSELGQTIGLNRLGIGPLEARRFHFSADVGRSRFSDRNVLLLDHSDERNPRWVRHFHDELVAVHEHQFLATTHYEIGGRLRHLGYFALNSR